MKRLGIILSLLIVPLVATTHGITLDALLQKTIERNPEIQKASHDLEQAFGRRLVFRAVAWPEATIGITAGAQGGQRAGEKPIQPFGFAYGNFSQPIFNAIVPPSLRRGDVELFELRRGRQEDVGVVRGVCLELVVHDCEQVFAGQPGEHAALVRGH